MRDRILRRWKRITYLYLSAVLLMFMLPCRAQADDKEYQIKSASFEAWLNEDGSADVEETWQVKYTKGSFTRFYKEINTKDLNEEERFSSLEMESVSINGQACTLTKDISGRPDNTYSMEGTGKGTEISMYLRSRNVTNEYRMRYRLHDVVRCVDGQYWLFVYRFIGKNFSKEVSKVRVTIHGPEGSSTKVLFASAGGGSAQDGGSDASLQASSSSGMFKVRLRIDGAGLFPGAVPITASQLTNRNLTQTGSLLLRFSLWGAVILAALGFTTGFFRWVAGIPARIQYRRNPELAEAKIGEVLSGSWMTGTVRNACTPAIEGACAIGPSENAAYLFAAGAYLAADGQVRGTPGGSAMQIRRDLASGSDLEMAGIHELLMRAAEPAQDGIWHTVTCDGLNKMIDEADPEKLYETALKVREPFDGRASRSKKSVPGGAWLRAVRKPYILKNGNISGGVLMEAVMTGHVTPRLLFDFLYTNPAGKPERSFAGSQEYNELYYLFADTNARGKTAYDRSHQSSSGSSCSACSSCSSCGGGGAD